MCTRTCEAIPDMRKFGTWDKNWPGVDMRVRIRAPPMASNGRRNYRFSTTDSVFLSLNILHRERRVQCQVITNPKLTLSILPYLHNIFSVLNLHMCPRFFSCKRFSTCFSRTTLRTSLERQRCTCWPWCSAAGGISSFPRTYQTSRLRSRESLPLGESLSETVQQVPTVLFTMTGEE